VPPRKIGGLGTREQTKSRYGGVQRRKRQGVLLRGN
jgi:hypothetical protein